LIRNCNIEEKFVNKKHQKSNLTLTDFFFKNHKITQRRKEAAESIISIVKKATKENNYTKLNILF
jgi:hypothetical protein